MTEYTPKGAATQRLVLIILSGITAASTTWMAVQVTLWVTYLLSV